MSLEQLPSLHTDLGVNGHAHPPPTDATMSIPTTAEETLCGLLAGLTFDVQLRDVAFGPHCSDTAPQLMHLPQVRWSKRMPRAVNHLDDVSCWKGMSNAQTLELALWEHLFQQCLASRIEERLHRSIIVQMSKHGECDDEYTLVPRLLQCVPKEHIRFIDIDVQALVRDMINAFYNDHPSKTASPNFRWALDSRDLPSFVYNFLCTHDCFQDTPAGPCLYVRCTLDWSEYPCLSVVAHVAWQPPDVRFHHVPVEIASRGQYIITPSYVPVLGGLQAASYKLYADDIVYTVTKSLSIIQWDPKASMFRAQAPCNEKGTCPKVSETLIEAHLVTKFPKGVRFKRISRYEIRTQVLNPAQNTVASGEYASRTTTPKKPWVPSYSNTPVSKTRPHISLRKRTDSPLADKVNGQRYTVDDNDKKCAKLATDAPVPEVGTLHDSVEGASPKKRKPSLLRATILDSDIPTDGTETSPKRRKLDGHEGVTSNTSTLSVEEESIEPQSTPDTVPQVTHRSSPENSDEEEHAKRLRHIESFRDLFKAYRMIPSSELEQTQPSKSTREEEINFIPTNYIKSRRSHIPSPPATSSPRSRQLSPTDTTASTGPAASPQLLPSPPPPSPECSPISPPYTPTDIRTFFTRIDSCHKHPAPPLTLLSQEQIQNNYREFEERAAQGNRDNKMGDVGDMNFERIFLFGDSEAENESWNDEDDEDGDVDDLSGEISGLELE